MYFAADHETRNDNEELSAIYDIKALEGFLIIVLVFGSIQTLSHLKENKTAIRHVD